MKQMTPLNKMSKKRQKTFHAQRRGSWNGLSPVTRVVPNKKAYDRKRARQASRREDFPEDCPARFLSLRRPPRHRAAAPLTPAAPAAVRPSPGRWDRKHTGSSL